MSFTITPFLMLRQMQRRGREQVEKEARRSKPLRPDGDYSSFGGCYRWKQIGEDSIVSETEAKGN